MFEKRNQKNDISFVDTKETNNNGPMESIGIIHPEELRDLVEKALRSTMIEVLPGMLKEADASPYMNLREVTELTGLNARAIAYRRETGQLPFVQHGRLIRYPRAAVLRWLESGRVPANVESQTH